MPNSAPTFEAMVSDALDRLPDWVLETLTHVPILVLDDGRQDGGYGLYHGEGLAQARSADRIVIYRDTLVRDYGHDPDVLAAEVERTVRHEIAHHLGYAESGVAALGL